MDAIPEFRRDILVSVRPIYASKILHGQKTVELRRKFPEVGATGALVFIYSSSLVSAVVGCARIKHVLKLPVSRVWKEYGVATCTSKHEFDAYFAGLKDGFAILFECVKSLKRQLEAVELEKQHRDCWVLEIENEIAGLVIRKDENYAEAGTRNPGPKVLKICTFKVRDEFQGEKFGELLLKQVLWFVQRNTYDLTYVTAYPKHAFLIDMLAYYGFRETMKMDSGEIVLEKPIADRRGVPGRDGKRVRF
jgi:predicted transcriptional regulator